MRNPLLESILKDLPHQPRSADVNDDPGFWTDGEEILCPSEAECEIVADFLEDMFREVYDTDVHTGYYDPDEDDRNGERDDHTGFYYIGFD